MNRFRETINTYIEFYSSLFMIKLKWHLRLEAYTVSYSYIKGSSWTINYNYHNNRKLIKRVGNKFHFQSYNDRPTVQVMELK